jgi:hypothetical protein
MFVFGTYASSLARDIAVRFPHGVNIDLSRAFDLMYRMRRYECPPLFRLWKRERSVDVTSAFEQMSINMRVPVPILRKHFDIVGIFKREFPPGTVLSRLDYDTWLDQQNYTDAFGSVIVTDCPERPPTFSSDEDHTEVFFDPSVACISMLQLVESAELSIVLRTREGTFPVKSSRMLAVKWRLKHTPEHPKLQIPVFLESSTITVPISGYYNADTDSEHLYTNIMMTLVTLEMPDGSSVEYVVNPWSRVTRTERIVKKENFVGGEIIDELSSTSVQLLRYTSKIEENIRLCWTALANAPYYTAIPSPWEAISDLCRGVILFGTVRDFKRGFTSLEMPSIERRTCIDLMRATCEYHVAHMAARSIATGSGEQAIGTVTVAYGPVGTHAILYASAVTTIGTRIRMSHIAIVSDNPTEFCEFLRENWKDTWIDETRFLLAASGILRASEPVHLIPIPCTRQYYRDTFTASYVCKSQWRMLGCGCMYCMQRRPAVMAVAS